MNLISPLNNPAATIKWEGSLLYLDFVMTNSLCFYYMIWVPLSYSLVPHLSKKFYKLLYNIYNIYVYISTDSGGWGFSGSTRS